MRATKRVYQFDKEGKFIEDFPCTRTAANSVGFTRGKVAYAIRRGSLLNGWYFTYNKDFVVPENLVQAGGKSYGERFVADMF